MDLSFLLAPVPQSAFGSFISTSTHTSLTDFSHKIFMNELSPSGINRTHVILVATVNPHVKHGLHVELKPVSQLFLIQQGTKQILSCVSFWITWKYQICIVVEDLSQQEIVRTPRGSLWFSDRILSLSFEEIKYTVRSLSDEFPSSLGPRIKHC